MAQSSSAGCEVAIEAATVAGVELSTIDDVLGAYRFETPRANQLTLAQGRDVRMEVLTGQNSTDVKLTSPTVLVAGNLQLSGQHIYATNTSMTVRPGVDSDVVLRPTGEGRVLVYGPAGVVSDDPAQGGTLKVGLDGDTHTLEMTRRLPEHALLDMSGEVNIGHRSQTGALRVWGRSNVSDDLTIDGNLIINNGDMNLGKADVICGSSSNQGDLSIGGDTIFGRFANNTLETPATVRFLNGSEAEVENIRISPITGSVVSKGSLVVEQQAEFGEMGFSQVASSVVFGTQLQHTVDILASVTTLVSMNASGDSQLGAVDNHDVILYGDWKQTTWNHTRLFEVDGSTGDTFANLDMYVEKDSHISSSVSIGDPINYANLLTYDEWLVQVFGHALAESFRQTIRTGLLGVVAADQLIDVWGADPRADLHALMVMEDNLQFASVLSSIGLDDSAAAANVATEELQRKFLLALSRVGDTLDPSMLVVQSLAVMGAPVHLMDTLQVDGTTHLTQMSVGLCSQDNPDTPEDESEDCHNQLQVCDNLGEGCATTLKGGITVFDGYNTLMTAQPDSGDMNMAGSVKFYGNADLQSSVSLGREDATIIAEGDVLLHSTLGSHKNFAVESDATIDGDLNVAKDATVKESLTVLRDAYLGSHASGNETDEVRVYGDLLTMDPAGDRSLFIDATGRSMHTDGQLTVQGTTELLESTNINASATVNGRAELGASLTVDMDTSISIDAVVSGKSQVKQTLVIGANATIGGNSELGSLGFDVEAHGDLLVQSVDSTNPLLLVQPDTGAAVVGSLTVSALVTFDDDVDLGSKSPPLGINVLCSSQFEGPVVTSEMTVDGQMVLRDSVQMNAGVSTQGDVLLGGALQEGTAAAMTVRGTLQLKDNDGLTIVEIMPASGDMELTGDLSIRGDMFIDGQMASPEFSARAVITDQINEIEGSDDGVTVEGVLFRDGAVERTLINEMVELIPEKGVTVEGATSKGGALVLRSDVNPDMLTLTNQNHDFIMDNVTTGIDWDQYYHHSLGANEDGSAPMAHAARVSVATTNSWTEEPGTHNSHVLFETAYQGQRGERARIATDGDFILAYDEHSETAKVWMDSEVGDVRILGDIDVGDTPDYNSHGNRTLEIRSEAERSTFILDAGGVADSVINLKILGGSELTIRNVNYYSPDRDYQQQPTLVFNDAHADIMTLDTLGNLWVSGSIEVGDFDGIAAATYEQLRLDDPDLPAATYPDTLVHLQSTGATDLSITAGPSSDARVMITSGPNQDATLRLVDPADSTSSSTFIISNRGSSANATLAIADGDSDLIDITDQGDVGAARFHGDFIATATGSKTRAVRVQSQQAALFNVQTGVDASGADATVTVTAGHNRDASLVLTDPDGDADSTSYNSKRVFAIVNVGEFQQVEWTDRDDVVQAQASVLAVVNGETTDDVTGEVSPNHVIALDDVGSVANLRITGNGQFGELPVEANPDAGVAGSPGTTVPVTFAVQSSSSAIMTLIAGCDDSGMCNDAAVELSSGDNANSILELSAYITEMAADAWGEMTIENQVRSTMSMFNMGTREIAAEAQLQSLWTTQNPILRTTLQTEGHDEYNIMQIVDQGEYGDLAISGSGYIVGSGERGVQIGSNMGSQPSYLNLVSGEEADAVVMIQSEQNLQPGLTLYDTSESGAATFTIRNDGSFATPRMQIVDQHQSSLLEVHAVCNNEDSSASKCVGDLYATGDVVFGSPDSTTVGMDTGDRFVRVGADQAAAFAVESGLESDASITISSGDDKMTKISLVPHNGTDTDQLGTAGFEIARKTSWMNSDGDEQVGNALHVSYMEASLFSITDVDKTATQSVGNLAVSGDVTIGDSDLDSRSLAIASMSVASLAVQSGDFHDAELGLFAGNGATASVRLETSSLPETDGDPEVENVFQLTVDGSSSGQNLRTLKVTDETNDFLILTDAGVVGNVEITGNGLFGSGVSPFVDQVGATNALPTLFTVQAPNTAMLDVIGAQGASLHITAGVDAPSQISLSARPEKSGGGHGTSSYLWTNRGHSLTLQDSAHTNVTVMEIADLGETGKLSFSGDTTFSTIGLTESVMQPNGQEVDIPVDATVTVISSATARLAIHSGSSSAAELTLESGDNRASILTLRSRADTVVGNTVQTTYTDFAFVNDGSAAQPQFQITDGVNPIFTIEDNTGETLVSLPGTLVCESLVSSMRTVLGNDVNSEIVINGHIASQVLNFDNNEDGVMLRIHFEDPLGPTTIVMPDESGTLLTTATAFSQLEGVDDLVAGQIAEGFGSITTSSDIMTSANIASDGTVRIESNFNAHGGIYIGDESVDDVHFRGVFQHNMRFGGDGCDTTGCELGVLFHASQDQLQSSASIGLGLPGKRTILKGEFDADSPIGNRQILIPDVPMGGMLHVNDNKLEVAEATNVHQVAFAQGATVGEIKSYSGSEPGSGLLPGESDIINLVNPRIKTTSTVIATVSDPGDPQLGGWALVTAVKVSQTDGQCTIKVTNMHPTRQMVDQYQVGFVVFNPNQ